VYAWSHPFVIASLVVFGVTAPLFVYVESVVALPIMPLGIICKSTIFENQSSKLRKLLKLLSSEKVLRKQLQVFLQSLILGSLSQHFRNTI